MGIENDSIQVVHQALCVKMEPEPSSEVLCSFKKLDDGQEPKKKSVNFTHAVFTRFDCP
jgi:hypothetical protein